MTSPPSYHRVIGRRQGGDVIRLSSQPLGHTIGRQAADDITPGKSARLAIAGFPEHENRWTAACNVIHGTR